MCSTKYNKNSYGHQPQSDGDLKFLFYNTLYATGQGLLLKQYSNLLLMC